MKPRSIRLRFAGLNELVHLAQQGEMVPGLGGHGTPAPFDTRQPHSHLPDRHEPLRF